MKGIAFLPGFISAVITLGIILPASSQVTSDGTTNTTVNINNNNFNILNGIQKGNNLFHSFQEFSIPTGSSATFNNSSAIENIINRVTGGNISNIDGLIKANGSANLFLINPAGIVFGENARLNIGGSFLGSTAESLLFEDGFEFSAVNAQSEPLLTISVPLGLQYGANSSSIQATSANLTVNSGKNLALLGGDVTISNSQISAPGGNIQIAAYAANNFLDLNQDGTINSTNTANLQNIQLEQGTSLNIGGSTSGSTNGLITLLGNNIKIANDSKLIADALENTPAGGIEIQAKDTLSLKNAFISATTTNIGNTGIINITGNSVEIKQSLINNGTSGAGDAGGINITAASEFLTTNSTFNSTSTADGNAGNVNITTDTFTIKEIGINNHASGSGDAGSINITATNSFTMQNAGMFNHSSGEGRAGNINYTADTIFINSAGFNNRTSNSGDAGNINITGNDINISQVGFGNDTSGSGNAGDINITANQNISMSQTSFGNGTSSSGNAGDINFTANQNFSISKTNFGTITSSSGNAGDVNFTADNLTISEVSFGTDTNGSGNAGNISITANELLLEKSGFGAITNSSGRGGNINIQAVNFTMLSEAGFGANVNSIGDGGEINITVDDTFLMQESLFGTDNFGEGKAGNINVTARNIILEDSGFSASTHASGDGGVINVTADSIMMYKSGFDSEALENSTGNAGDVNVTVGSLILNESGIGNEAKGTGGGRGAQITIQADTITLQEEGDETRRAEIDSQSLGTGDSGGIKIITEELNINGGIISVANFGSGGGSELEIQAESLNLTEEGSIFAANGTGGTGSGSSVKINSNNLLLQDGSNITVATGGEGIGGNLELSANNLQVMSGSQIDSSSVEQINFDDIFVRESEQINNLELVTTTLPEGTIYGDAGNIVINADELTVQGVDNNGNPSRIAAFSQTNAAAGSVQLNTDTLSINSEGEVNLSGLSTGNAGNLNIKANFINLDNTGNLIVESNAGNQGNINLISDFLLLRNNSKITTNASGTANGGNITINSPIIAGFENSDIIANAEQGNGGNIDITTSGIFGLTFRDRITPDSDITASSQFGINGTVEINNISIDPSSGLFELPTEVTDPSQQIAAGCSSNNDSSFVATGRGGMPQNPTESVDLNPSWSDIRDLSAFRQKRNNTTVENPQISNQPAIVEATGFMRNEDGVIELVALDNTPLKNKQVIRCSG